MTPYTHFTDLVPTPYPLNGQTALVTGGTRREAAEGAAAELGAAKPSRATSNSARALRRQGRHRVCRPRGRVS